jgi:soluble lytic murein transglycosylase
LSEGRDRAGATRRRRSARPPRWLAALVCAARASVASAEGTADEAPVTESGLEDLLESGSGSAQRTRRYEEADLAPYFAAGPLAAAKASFDRGRHARARALLAGDAPPVRYLRALAAVRADPATAAAELRALADDYPPMRDHCLFHAGRALERVRKRRAAAAAYGEVSARSTLFAEARLARSRVLERSLDLDGAIEALEPIRALPATPRYDAARRRALLAAALLYQKKLDFPGEHRAMLELWATSPLSPEAKAVWERLKQLPIPNAWRLRRAESFLSFHDHAEAMRLALQVKTVLPDEHACRAAFVVGSALRKQRQHRKAMAALAPAVDACGGWPARPDAMYLLGYSQSIVAADDAVRTYDALAREHPGHPFADDALYFAAELDLRAGRRREALDRLEGAVAAYPDGNFAAEALFLLAAQHRAAGAHAAALAALDRIERLAVAGREHRLRARYWRARSLAARGDAAAAPEFAAISAESSASWYGLLARDRATGGDGDGGVAPALACASRSDPAPSAWPLEAGPLGADPRFLAGVELLRMDLPGAAEELLAVERSGLPEDAARLLVEALQRTRRPKTAALVARATLARGLAGSVDERTVGVWEAAYPRPYRGAVERWARAAGVEPDLLQALMREESRFDRWARSWAGAIGLTQLMPRTAQAVASELKLRRVTAAALHAPQLNIRLGAAYLGELLSTFDGSKVLAIAAYNAGPQAVERWLDARPDAELDEWVEQIPAAETRDYVKRVLGSYAAYRLVYGGAPAALEEPGEAVPGRGLAGRLTRREPP